MRRPAPKSGLRRRSVQRRPETLRLWTDDYDAYATQFWELRFPVPEGDRLYLRIGPLVHGNLQEIILGELQRDLREQQLH